MKFFFTTIATGFLAATAFAADTAEPDKELECDLLDEGTACTYTDPSGKSQTGTCQVNSDPNSPLYTKMLCTKTKKTGTGTDSSNPDPSNDTGDGPSLDEQSVDVLACSDAEMGAACSYTLRADSSDAVTMKGFCQQDRNVNGLVCVVNNSGDDGASQESVVDAACDNLAVNDYCEITYGDMVVEGKCTLDPADKVFCMPDTGGYDSSGFGGDTTTNVF